MTNGTQTLGLALLLVSACSASSGDDGSGGTSGKGPINPGTFPTAPPTLRVLDAHPVLSDTKASVRVVLSHPAKATVSVELETADGTATSAAGDYEPVQKVVTFAPGITEAVVSVPVQTPYETLTLDTALDRRFETRLSNPQGATLDDAEGSVTLGHAGMVIETPLASKLLDGDIVPDFNGDGAADLVLSGTAGKGSVLLTPKTRFEEAGHAVLNETYLDGERAFSWEVAGGALSFTVGIFAGDASMTWDQDGDGLSDVAILGEQQIHLLYGSSKPSSNFSSADPRLADGIHATRFTGFEFIHGSNTIQTADYDGDGAMDFAQAGSYSSAEGGTDKFQGFYGALGKYGPEYIPTDAFGFGSGTTPVGDASLVSGTRPGVRADLNGDGLDDMLFVGLAGNDGHFGGNHMYARFGDGIRVVGDAGALNGTFDGTDGFQVSHNYPANNSSFEPQDSGDVNGDGVEDLLIVGGSATLSVIFGKASYTKGSYAEIHELENDVIVFETDPVVTARIGDLNRDGFGDIVFVSGSKLRVVWGAADIEGKPIFGTQYPEVGELDIAPESGLDSVSIVGDLDGDQTSEVIILSSSWSNETGGALVMFGKTLTRLLGGPDLDYPVPK